MITDRATGMALNDFVEGDEDCDTEYWTQVCSGCAEKHGLKQLSECVGDGFVCGVQGCKNEADYYYDFGDKL